MSVIKLDLRQAFYSHRLYLVPFIALVLAILGIYQSQTDIAFAYSPIGGINLFFIGFVRSAPMTLMMPFLAMVSSSDKLYMDIKSGTIKAITSKIPLSKYITQRLITTALIGGLSVTIALSIGLLALCIYDSTPAPFIFSSCFIPLLEGLYSRSMLLALEAFIVNGFLCGATYAVFTMSLMAWTRMRALSYLFPIIVSIIMNFLNFLSSSPNIKVFNSIAYYLNFDLYTMNFVDAGQMALKYSIFLLASFIFLILSMRDFTNGGN